MEKIVLEATRRTVTGKKVGALRREGILPAIMYGSNFETTSVSLDQREASRILHHATASSLITIKLDGAEHAVLVREKQRDYIKGNFIHIDFQVVSLTEKIRATVIIEIIGTSPAVKEYNGVVISGLSNLEVESLPQDLPEKFVIDISNLMEIGDAVHVRDIKVSDNVEILTDPDEMLVLVTSGTMEEEEEIVAEEAAAEEPEIIERGKKEEEEEED